VVFRSGSMVLVWVLYWWGWGGAVWLGGGGFRGGGGGVVRIFGVADFGRFVGGCVRVGFCSGLCCVGRGVGFFLAVFCFLGGCWWFVLGGGGVGGGGWASGHFGLVLGWGGSGGVVLVGVGVWWRRGLLVWRVLGMGDGGAGFLAGRGQFGALVEGFVFPLGFWLCWLWAGCWVVLFLFVVGVTCFFLFFVWDVSAVSVFGGDLWVLCLGCCLCCCGRCVAVGFAWLAFRWLRVWLGWLRWWDVGLCWWFCVAGLVGWLGGWWLWFGFLVGCGVRSWWGGVGSGGGGELLWGGGEAACFLCVGGGFMGWGWGGVSVGGFFVCCGGFVGGGCWVVLCFVLFVFLGMG